MKPPVCGSQRLVTPRVGLALPGVHGRFPDIPDDAGSEQGAPGRDIGLRLAYR
ncbi:hypothetical protein GU243_10080 [Pseudarthrobacter psychrotolerans]|uniref:Uncharacterized protein n=1 Tax=Pseudarthrobacter psychrotolerans TaxID=2697569 RepID=A0A6P1NR63_9MICC|nr:hypothetical protein [Pseudarthrobacter psychrotolerans]QHK20022.1 hypothetical protein GU243_10080 [Pseudarthrobacter psychrotolerans]